MNISANSVDNTMNIDGQVLEVDLSAYQNEWDSITITDTFMYSVKNGNGQSYDVDSSLVANLQTLFNAAIPPEPTPPTLEELKSIKIKEIDRKTDELIAAGFQFDGNTFSLSLNAQSNFMGIKVATDSGLLTEASFPYNLTTLDDDTYQLQWADKETFFGLVLNSVATRLDSGRPLKAAVKEATTVEELDSIVDGR